MMKFHLNRPTTSLYIVSATFKNVASRKYRKYFLLQKYVSKSESFTFTISKVLQDH